jgi:hypothetical protein
MKNDLYFYGIGTAFAAAVSASLIFGWALGTTAGARTDSQSAVPTAESAAQLIRVVLASPFAQEAR